jgi:hypothetical protein
MLETILPTNKVATPRQINKLKQIQPICTIPIVIDKENEIVWINPYILTCPFE